MLHDPLLAQSMDVEPWIWKASLGLKHLRIWVSIVGPGTNASGCSKVNCVCLTFEETAKLFPKMAVPL